jgi:hypothetical protein
MSPTEQQQRQDVREEILLAKIQLETENCELKDSCEKLEREYLKLRSLVAEMHPPPLQLPFRSSRPISCLQSQQQQQRKKKESNVFEKLFDVVIFRSPSSAFPSPPPSAIPQPSSPEISPGKDTRADDLSHLSDAGLVSLLAQEIS